MAIEKSVDVKVIGHPAKINLVWADGMIGACPVFSTKEEAEKYRDKSNAQIYEVQESSTSDKH